MSPPRGVWARPSCLTTLRGFVPPETSAPPDRLHADVARLVHLLTAVLACALFLPAAAAAQITEVPRASTLPRGWEMREEPAKPGEPQVAPPEEGAPEDAAPPAPPVVPPAASAAQVNEHWRAVQVPSVFDSRALARDYVGEVRRYRLTFTAPVSPRGFSWLIRFEEVRRAARVYLNGRLIGGNRDPYTPFTLPARGLKPGKRNTLVVIVDNRKNTKLPEGWWNWGGILRPVRLIPAGHAYLNDLGTMSRVSCRGEARSCKASLLLDGVLQRR